MTVTNKTQMHAFQSSAWLKNIYTLLSRCEMYASESNELNWIRHSIAMEELHVPSDLDQSQTETSFACGPVAFAAITGIPISDATSIFPKTKERAWINRREMQAALTSTGFAYTRKEAGQWPTVGISLIHFTGRWTTGGYPARILQHSHWVAVIGDYIFDVNWTGWLPKENWGEVVLEPLLRSRPGADGWSVINSYELCGAV